MKSDFCRDCPLYDCQIVHGTIVVNTPEEYPPSPELMIIGRDPGKEEIRNGLPFVGRSGKLLRQTLKKLGVKRYYLTNACKCRPPQNIVNYEAGKKCIYFLEMELRLINPSKVVVLGNDAQRWTTYIDWEKNMWFEITHPAFIARQYKYYDHWLEQWKEML